MPVVSGCVSYVLSNAPNVWQVLLLLQNIAMMSAALGKISKL